MTQTIVFGETIPNTTHRYRYLKSAFPQPLPTLPMSREDAIRYMRECMRVDLRMRVCDARVDTFMARLDAISMWTVFVRASPLSVEPWRHPGDVTLRPMRWSSKPQGILDNVADRTNIRDSNGLAIIDATNRAAEVGARALIL